MEPFAVLQYFDYVEVFDKQSLNFVYIAGRLLISHVSLHYVQFEKKDFNAHLFKIIVSN